MLFLATLLAGLGTFLPACVIPQTGLALSPVVVLYMSSILPCSSALTSQQVFRSLAIVFRLLAFCAADPAASCFPTIEGDLCLLGIRERRVTLAARRETQDSAASASCSAAAASRRSSVYRMCVFLYPYRSKRVGGCLPMNEAFTGPLGLVLLAVYFLSEDLQRMLGSLHCT